VLSLFKYGEEVSSPSVKKTAFAWGWPDFCYNNKIVNVFLLFNSKRRSAGGVLK